MEKFDTQTIAVIAALQAVVQALVKTHPNGKALRVAIEEQAEPLRAMWLGGPTPEAAIEMFDAYLSVVKSRLAP